MTRRLFDLNIEEMLENWAVEHALREIIANALDEQILSSTQDISIFRDADGGWHIRDYGRGLRIEHFTLNENSEKLAATSGVIGKFGVGLKDALATFHRKNISVVIQSRYGTYRLRTAEKHSFSEIVTLHVEYDDCPTDVPGTELILRGVGDADMAKAKSLFLRFAGEEVLETTAYGQILRRQDTAGRVYILGVFANEEPNFAFSYNITSLTGSMRSRLNRERLNVGRTTYAQRVRTILTSAKSDAVHNMLVKQVDRRAKGDQCDEMGWIEISQMALNLMHQKREVVYFTEEEIQTRPNILDTVRRDGYKPVVVTEKQKTKLVDQMQSGGAEVRTVEKYVEEYNSSFQYEFISQRDLTRKEKQVYDRSLEILALVGIRQSRAPKIKISNTMRATNDDTGGVWDPSIPAIVIKRSQLASFTVYSATVLHELAHATSGAVDASREFENVLTTYLGQTANKAIGR